MSHPDIASVVPTFVDASPPRRRSALSSVLEQRRLVRRLDDLVRTVRRSLRARLAVITLGENTWAHAKRGLHSPELKFTGDAVIAPGTQSIPNLATDDRADGHPLSVMMRSYFSQAIYLGQAEVGTVAILDDQDRAESTSQRDLLRDLAALIERELTDALDYEAMQARLQTAERRASIDPLTRVFNKSLINEMLRRELRRSARGEACVGVIMIDLDHFKTVNDTFGHQRGDRVLQGAAARLKSALREYDAIGRFGGEEFLCVVSVKTPEEALIVAERLCESLATSPVDRLMVTASVGLAVCEPGQRLSGSTLVARADRALYRAKGDGRNRVVDFTDL